MVRFAALKRHSWNSYYVKRSNSVHSISLGGSSIFTTIRRLPFLVLLHRQNLHLAVKDESKPAVPIYGEKYLRRLLWFLLGGTRGGPSRVWILKALRQRPLNANQLASTVGLDYKTIEHHIRVLKENGLVTSEKGTYGALLFLTSTIEEAWPLVEEIWGKIGRTKINTSGSDRRSE